VVDYAFVRQRINEVSKVCTIEVIEYDPWNATQLAHELQDDDGFNMVQCRQGFISMNEPSKELERLVLSGDLNHGGHPVLRWMAANIAVKLDPAANIKPDKQASGGRIDGIVGLIMAIRGATLEPVKAKSVYAERGLLSI